MSALYMLGLFCFLFGCGGNAIRSDIIHGKKTKLKSKPYMASVQNRKGHLCGGFLVSEDFVMTAAHCDEKNPTSVVLGAHNLRKVVDETMRYPVAKRCKHPSYEKVSHGYDIMLLKLSRKVQPGKKVLIKPIKLPTREVKLKEKKKCSVAGWGFAQTRGEVVDDLQEVEVPVINLQTCRQQWKTIPPKVICAGGYGTKKGICQGDSGGPLVCDKVAVGVVSYNHGFICSYPELPNVYTDISKFIPWINKILEDKTC